MAIPNAPRTHPVVLSVLTRHHNTWGKRVSFKHLLRFLWPWEGKVWHPLTLQECASVVAHLLPASWVSCNTGVFFHNKILLNSQWDAETWSKPAWKRAASFTSHLGHPRRQLCFEVPILHDLSVWKAVCVWSCTTQCVDFTGLSCQGHSDCHFL